VDRDGRQQPLGLHIANGAHGYGFIGVTLGHLEGVVLTGVVNAPIVVPGQWGLRGSLILSIALKKDVEWIAKSERQTGTRILELLIKI